MSIRRILSSILLSAYLSSCTSWRIPPVSPERAVTEDQPAKVQVTLTDSSQVEMKQPVIVGDTLRGMVEGPPSKDAPRGTEHTLVTRDIVMADIAELRVARPDVGKSIVVGLGVVAGTYMVLAVSLGWGDRGGEGWTGDECLIC